MVALTVALPIMAAVPLLYVPEWRHASLDTSIGAYHAEELAGRQLGTTFTDEFRPRAVHSLPSPTARLLADYADGYPIDKLNRAALPAGVRADLVHNSPQALAWRIDAQQAFPAEIYNFYWLGWRAEVDGRPLSIQPSAHHGLITLSLPAGDYELRVFLGSTAARDIAFAITCLAFLVMLGCLWRLRLHQPPARPYRSAAPLPRHSLLGILLGGGIALLIVFIAFREGIAWIHSRPGQALPAQHQSGASLDEKLLLLGYDIGSERVTAGDTLVVNAYWYALEQTDVDFSSFLHLSSGGPPHAQIDKLHPGGRAISEWWRPAGYIFDAYALPIPADLPAGDYDLIIGLYTCALMPPGECGNGYRPTVRGAAGEILGDSIRLATISVDVP